MKKDNFDTCLIVGSGPSLDKKQVYYAVGKGCPIIAVNSSFIDDPAGDPKPWFHPDIVYGADERWWIKYHKLVRGEGWGNDCDWSRRLKINIVGVRAPFGNAYRGLAKEPYVVNAGGNSGYQAINLAYHFGATTILLDGFDFQFTGGKKHIFGDHPKGWANCTYIENWPGKMNELAKDLVEEGVKVINCSRETALTCFERAKIEDCL